MITTWKIAAVAAAIFAAGGITGGLVSTRLGLGQRPAPQGTSPNAHDLQQSTSENQPEPSRPSPPPQDFRRKDRPPGGMRPPGNQRLEVLRHLEDSLPLDPAQRERIRALVHESDQRIRREWDPVYPRIQGELRDLRRRIAAELRPEQRVKLDALLDRKASRRNDEAPPALR
jgi:hypothetical protein